MFYFYRCWPRHTMFSHTSVEGLPGWGFSCPPSHLTVLNCFGRWYEWYIYFQPQTITSFPPIINWYLWGMCDFKQDSSQGGYQWYLNMYFTYLTGLMFNGVCLFIMEKNPQRTHCGKSVTEGYRICKSCLHDAIFSPK